jgi:hypothetical protein
LGTWRWSIVWRRGRSWRCTYMKSKCGHKFEATEMYTWHSMVHIIWTNIVARWSQRSKHNLHSRPCWKWLFFVIAGTVIQNLNWANSHGQNISRATMTICKNISRCTASHWTLEDNNTEHTHKVYPGSSEYNVHYETSLPHTEGFSLLCKLKQKPTFSKSFNILKLIANYYRILSDLNCNT